MGKLSVAVMLTLTAMSLSSCSIFGFEETSVPVIASHSGEDMIDENAIYNVGDKVIHDKYGEGIIVGIGNLLTIAFSHKYGIIKIMKGHKSIRKV